MIRLRPGLWAALAVQKWSPPVPWKNSAPMRRPNVAGTAVGVLDGVGAARSGAAGDGVARRKRSRFQARCPAGCEQATMDETRSAIRAAMRIVFLPAGFFPYAMTREP